MESMPRPCFVGDSYPYMQKHDPFIYFNDIRTNATECNKVVPCSTLATDLKSAGTTPNYAWITPNMCNDMHDCSVSTGDTWLKNNLGAYATWAKSHNSLLVVTTDEDDGSATNHIPTLFYGQPVTSATTATASYNHYDVLRTLKGT